LKYLAIYYGLGVAHLILTMINDEEEYKALVEYCSDTDTAEVYTALFIVLVFMPFIWPKILFHQIFSKDENDSST
jgi:hypothetical protein